MANSVQTSSLANNLATNNLAIDAKSLDKLKYAADQSSPEAIKAAAKQFESVLMNMMLKSMREATPQDGMMDNEQSRMFTSMLDQQLSTHLTQKGLGLADVLARQLSASTQKVMPADSVGTNALNQALKPSSQPAHVSTHDAKTIHSADKPTVIQALAQAKQQAYEQLQALEASMSDGIENQLDALTPILNEAKTSLSKVQWTDLPGANIAKQLGDKAQAFVSSMTQHAQAASQVSGIPAKFMLGQAGLETGWGQKQIKTINGENSHNLFGIKAGNGWNGKVAVSATTEYINGVKQTRYEKFRAYDSYADAFKDYAKLISDNPRYQQAMANTHDAKAYAYALQRAGYATDPQYGKKLTQVIAKISG